MQNNKHNKAKPPMGGGPMGAMRGGEKLKTLKVL